MSDNKKELTAEQKLSFQNDLIQMIVHDLKSPLMGISANLDLLANSEQLPELEKEIAQTALEGSEELHGMVMDMLALGKMEAGALVLETSSADMGEIAEKEVRKLAQLSDDKGVTIRLEKVGGLVANVDEKLMGRVMANFLSNSLKYSPPGKTVTVTAKEEGESVRLQFLDNGVGVPEEYGDTIFDKYVQVEMRTHKRKGATGLGLPFCRMAVEAHSGQVGLNRLDQGSEFYFLVPKNG